MKAKCYTDDLKDSALMKMIKYQPEGTNPRTIHIPDEWEFNMDQMVLREETAPVQVSA